MIRDIDLPADFFNNCFLDHFSMGTWEANGCAFHYTRSQYNHISPSFHHFIRSGNGLFPWAASARNESHQLNIFLNSLKDSLF